MSFPSLKKLFNNASYNGPPQEVVNGYVREAGRGNEAAVIAFLEEYNDSIDKKSIHSWTALMMAAWAGHKDMVALLLERGAQPGIKDKANWTAERFAREHGHHEVVRLLRHWPEIRKKNIARLKQENIRKERAGEIFGIDDLSAVIERGDCQQVRDFFDAAFWNNQAVTPGWEHLKIALLRKDKPMIRLLVSRDVNVSGRDISALGAQDVALLRQCGLNVPEFNKEVSVAQGHYESNGMVKAAEGLIPGGKPSRGGVNHV